MATTLPAKNAADVLNYGVNWSSALEGDSIVTSAFVLTVPAGLAINSQGFTTIASNVVLSGGTAGLTATITNTVTTLGGLTLVETIYLPVTDGLAIVAPSTSTKLELINMALEEASLDPYEFNPTPQEYSTAMRRLDALMGEWKTASIDLNYNFPEVFGQGDLADASGIPDTAINTTIMQLALRINPAIGKSMSPETRVALSQGMVALRTACAVIPERQLQGRTPLGQGNRSWRVFAPTPVRVS